MPKTCCSLVALLLAAPPLFAADPEPTFLDKPLSHWQRQLDHADAAKRRSAAFALGKLNREAVPALVRALADDDKAVAESAAFALGEIGTSAIAALPALLKFLNDPKAEPRLRRAAACAVGELRPIEKDAVRSLQQALRDGDAGVRQNAAWALGQLPATIASAALPALQERFTDDDALVRRDAVGALQTFGLQARSLLPALLQRLADETDSETRLALLHVLVNLLGPEDGSAAKVLRAALHDPNAETVRLAAVALGNIGGDQAAAAVPALRSALMDPALGIRRQAVGALANIGPEATAAVPELMQALSDTDTEVQSRAALALSRIGAKGEPAVPQLAKLLRSPAPEVRLYAAEALARIGRNLEPAVPDLVRLLQSDRELKVRQRAVWALGRLDDLEKAPQALAALEKVLHEKDPDTRLVRYEAARYLALCLLEKTPPKAIEILTAMLRDDSLQIYVRSEAKASSGGENSGGRTEVKPSIGGDGRTLPARALGFIGPKANQPAVIRALEALAKSSDPQLREAVQETLQKLRKQ
ncbi:MAG: HEAT repeat domain-containing protein [Planctomycetia bacterium]|nr:HEAT repeat domain-containing protein [Planctomycetia bacterium]